MLLRTLGRVVAYRLRHRTRYDTALMLSFLVTARCNLRCRHCFYHREVDRADRESELTLEEYRALSASMESIMGAVFAGGEPFIRRDLAEIIRLFQVNNDLLVAGIATNGQLTASTIRQTERMCRADRGRIVNVGVSIDGFRDEHDRIRGEGAFDRALRTLKELQRLSRSHGNLHLTVTTVVNGENQHTAGRLVRWVSKTLRPSAVNVMLIRQAPRSGDAIKEVSADNNTEAAEAAVRSVSRSRLVRRVPPKRSSPALLPTRFDKRWSQGNAAFTAYRGCTTLLSTTEATSAPAKCSWITTVTARSAFSATTTWTLRGSGMAEQPTTRAPWSIDTKPAKAARTRRWVICPRCCSPPIVSVRSSVPARDHREFVLSRDQRRRRPREVSHETVVLLRYLPARLAEAAQRTRSRPGLCAPGGRNHIEQRAQLAPSAAPSHPAHPVAKGTDFHPRPLEKRNNPPSTVRSRSR